VKGAMPFSYSWEALFYKLFGYSLTGESRGGRASSGGGLGVSPRFPSSPSPLARERGLKKGVRGHLLWQAQDRL